MDRRAKERLVGASMLVAIIVAVVPELLSGPKPAAQAPAQVSRPAAPTETRTYTVDLADGKLPAATVSPDGVATAASTPSAGESVAAGGTPADASPKVPGDAAAPPGHAVATSGPAGAGTGGASATGGALPDTAGEAKTAAPAVQPASVQSAAPPVARAPAVDSPNPSPTSDWVKTSHSGSGGWTIQLGSFASEDNAAKLAHYLKVKGYPVYVLSTGSGAMVRHRVRMGPLPDRDSALRMIAQLKAQGQAASLVPP